MNANTVLTAAHCVCFEQPLFAFAGRLVYPSRSDNGIQRYLDLSVEPPRLFNPEFCRLYSQDRVAAMRTGDLALLKLKHPFPDEISKQFLVPQEFTAPDHHYDKHVVVGWGERDNIWRPGKKGYSFLYIPVRSCTSEEVQLFDCKTSLEMAVADPPNDTCYADSGGPVYAIDRFGILRLLAVTSRAIYSTRNNLCGAGGVYTNLENPQVRTWLKENIDEQR
jgi:hypothetical protein